MEIPGYQIVRELGKGGMAAVYLAIQRSFGREVALKVMSPALSADPRFHERFIREAHIVSRLVHPNIVTVYDVGEHENHHYLSMEYVRGHDLRHMRDKLSLDDRVRVVKEVARALDYASKRGYVHRDVKPDNIMLHEEDGRAVLTDFGIARAVEGDGNTTQTGSVIGTPQYMSPEQARGGKVDHRADLYSLGVVLFQLLAGHVPYHADTPVAVAVKHITELVPRLPAQYRQFQPVIDKVLAKDPDDRFQSGAELIAALDGIGDLRSAETGEYSNRAAPASAVEPEPVPATEPVLALPQNVASRDRSVRPAGASAPADESFIMPEDYRRTPTLVEKRAKGVAWPLGVVTLIVAVAVGAYLYGVVPAPIAVMIHGALSRISMIVEGQTPQKPASQVPAGLAATKSTGLTAVPAPPPVAPASPKPAGAAAPAPSPTAPPASASVASSPAAPPANVPPSGTSSAPAPSIKAPPTKTTAATAPSGAAPSTAASAQAPVTSAPAGPTEPTKPSLRSTLEDKAAALHAKLADDPAVIPQLAALYLTVLTDSPDDAWARHALNDLQAYHLKLLDSALAAGDYPAAHTYLDMAQASYPAEVRDPQFARLAAQLQQVERVHQLLAQAAGYMKSNALTSPAGANALESFKAVLTAEPDNAAARAGIASIAHRYAELGRQQMQKGELDRALVLVHRGLGVSAKDEPLLQLQTEIEAAQARRQQVDRLLDDAHALLVAGQLIAPAGRCALDSYRKVLAIDSSNAQATAGVAQIKAALVDRIQPLLKVGDLKAAESALADARDRFPRSAPLLSLQEQLDQAVDAEQPKVTQLVVSATPLHRVDGVEPATLHADRTIFIGFRYANFHGEASVVQAVLYDGARSLQIAQVPVIVSGRAGVKFFQIDRPVEGFAEGGYNIDLMLDGRRLITSKFRVEDQNGG